MANWPLQAVTNILHIYQSIVINHEEININLFMHNWFNVLVWYDPHVLFQPQTTVFTLVPCVFLLHFTA